MEEFWIDLNRFVDRVGNGCRLCMMVDLDRVGITGAFEF